ncbi:hypothetical protein FNH21_01555 [Arthrobacter sp. KR32]|uniref:PKD domain-containing protein n=1 Tax=Arthrobacter bussei TaxID=2594179 RepID=A0A7X1NM85_9MICC|nr:hypothetical protein [Arthrobacter bussei]
MRVLKLAALIFVLPSLQSLGNSSSFAFDDEPPSAFVSEGSFSAVSSKQTLKLRSGEAKLTQPAAQYTSVEALPLPDDGIEYTYVRACTSGAGNDLDPAQCPRIDARCDAQEGGVLVNWIEVNSNVQPASQTPTGRSSCMYPGAPPEPPIEGPAAPAAEEAPIVITLEEFQKQPVLAATIISQPLNFGLKNAHSNVYAEAAEQEFTFDFRDATIVLKARPIAYQWSYGDGTRLTTSVPGGPVAGNTFDTQTPTSHQYADTGDFQLTLTTLFAGDYSVDGGPFQPVAGEAAVVSDPHLMSIWRTQGNSVSENCIENPSGIGCEAPTR